MAHLNQQLFCEKIRNKIPEHFENKRILDIGSLDINGNNKYLFTDSNYIGLDVGEGPNVDVISVGHLYSAPNNFFDTIISTEVFEHDMFYEQTVQNVVRMLKPGGLFIFTCASTGRPEHGTRRSDGSDAAPLLYGISPEWSDYYKNLTEKDFEKIDGFKKSFPDGYFEYNPESKDLYFYGIKGGKKINMIETPEVKYDEPSFNKHIFVVDAWPNNEEKEKTLVDCIKKLREFNIEILLATHFPIATEIQSMVDYYIFDKKNPLLTKEEFKTYDIGSGRWTKTNEYYVINEHEYHHDYAIWETMRNSFNFCDFLGKEYIHFMEYDNLIDTWQFRQSFVEYIESKDAIIYEYNEMSVNDIFSPYMATYLFSIRTDIANKLIGNIKNKDEYFRNRPEGFQLEKLFLKYLRKETSNIRLTNYIDNDGGLNVHAVWNRDGIDRDGAQFQAYPCVDKNKNVYLHIIHGFFSKDNGDDYLLEIRYKDKTQFISVSPSNKYQLIDLGKYQKGDTIKIYYQGGLVFNEFLTDEYEYFYSMNKVILNNQENDNITSNVHFVDGAFCGINGDSKNEYIVDFIDNDKNSCVYTTKLNVNMWSRPLPKYFINWKIQVKDFFGNVINEHILDLKNKKVYIAFESKSLGDTIAWVPICEQFRRKHGCDLVVSTFQNDLFVGQYPNIEFVNPGGVVNDLYAMYRLGVFYDNGNTDFYRHKNSPITLPLQKIASDILGLEYIEERPKFVETESSEFSNEKFVCIAPHATAHAKYWNRENGWQDVVNFLNDNGYKTVYISSESMNDDYHNGKIGGRLKGVINKHGNVDFKERISDLRKASAFIGVSSGLSWLAWGCGTPTVLISGFTEKYLEFQDCERIINTDVCHGCWHKHKFDPGDWEWCPEHKNSERHFECTKTITSEQVIQSLKKILGIV